MKRRSDNPADRIPERLRPGIPIWLGFLVPPLAALTHVQVSYTFDHTACATGTKLGIHLATIVLLAIVVVCGLQARRDWIRLGAEPPDQLPGPLGSRRLMALSGMIGAVVFGLFIVAQWFPNLMLGPCIRT